jgi:ArsR family transcriptional regulator
MMKGFLMRTPISIRTTIERDAAFLAAIGDPVRLRIVTILADKPHCVYELCGSVGKRQQAVSHHLTILKLRQIIERNRVGKRNYYKLTDVGRLAARLANRLGRTRVAG